MCLRVAWYVGRLMCYGITLSVGRLLNTLSSNHNFGNGLGLIVGKCSELTHLSQVNALIDGYEKEIRKLSHAFTLRLHEAHMSP